MSKRSWIAACGLALYLNVLSYPYFPIIFRNCSEWGSYPRIFPDGLLLMIGMVFAACTLAVPAFRALGNKRPSNAIGIAAASIMVASGTALQLLPASSPLPSAIHGVCMLALAVGFVVLCWYWFTALESLGRDQLILAVLVGFILSNVFCLVDQLPDLPIYVIYTALPLASIPFAVAVRQTSSEQPGDAPAPTSGSYRKVSALAIIIFVTVFIACSVIRGIWSRGGVGYWGHSSKTVESFAFSLAIGILLYVINKHSKQPVWAELFSCILFLAVVVLCYISSNLLGVLAIGTVMSAVNRALIAVCIIAFASHLSETKDQSALPASLYCTMFAFSLVLSNSLVPYLFRYVGKTDAQTMESIALLSLSCIVLGLCVFLVVFCVLLAREQKSEEGKTSQSTTVQDNIATLKEHANLTVREAEIASLIARGYTAKHIADELYLSVNTVRSYTKTLYRKLDIHSKDELIKLVRRVDN